MIRSCSARRCVALVLLTLATATGARVVAAQPSFSTDTIVLDHGAQDPAVSPDGQRIALSVLGKIWMIPVAGGTGTLLSAGTGWDRHPGWSRDGQFIAYAHQTSTGTDLVVRALATGETRSLYHTDGEIAQITYAPTTGDIYFVVMLGQYDAHIWRLTPVADIDGGGAHPEQLTHGDRWHEWTFALSPDAKHVLFDEGHEGGSDLYELDLTSRKLARLTRSGVTTSHLSTAWAPDGTQYYVERHDGVDRVIARTPSSGATRTVYTAPYDDKQIALMPDGRTAVLCIGRRLVRLDLATGTTTPIPFSAPTVVTRPIHRDLTITHARVIDATGAPPVMDATVEIRDGRIAAIHHGAPASGQSPTSTPVIDAHGMTLLPGLIDNHYHYWSPFEGRVQLYRGVTNVRDPGSPLSQVLNFKDAINAGIIPGPHIFATGPLVDGYNGYHPYCDVEIGDPAAAAALVKSMKASGVDAIKVYFMLNPDVLAAVVKAAHAEGLPVTGHIGVRTGWGQAADAGIDGVNHIRVWHDVLPLADQPNGDNASLAAGGLTIIPRMQADWHKIDPDGPAIGTLIQKMVAHHVVMDPTLAIQKYDSINTGEISPEQFTWAQESYEKMGRFVARSVRSGITLLAGTDNGNLFDEAEAYAAVGIPPMTILQSLTRNGAEWLGHGKEFGTIEVGKKADLLLVDGDPLQDITTLRNTQLVVQDGNIVFKR
jgi:imidazolonepropionase-like amidohydrolase